MFLQVRSFQYVSVTMAIYFKEKVYSNSLTRVYVCVQHCVCVCERERERNREK